MPMITVQEKSNLQKQLTLIQEALFDAEKHIGDLRIADPTIRARMCVALDSLQLADKTLASTLEMNLWHR